MFALPLLTRQHPLRRRAAAGLALALLVTVLAACGGGATGAQRTATPTQLPTATATATPAGPPPGVYFAADGSSSATVYALDSATGHVRWSRHITTSVGGIQMASTGDLIFIVDFFGTITALRMEDGTVLWSKVSHRGVSNQPVAGDGILFVSSTGDSLKDGYLDAYRATDGAQVWEHDAGLNRSVYLGAAANGVLYTGSGQEVDALRDTDGTTVWRVTMSAPAAAPQIVSGNAIYLNDFGEVYALDAATGTQIWHYRPQSPAGEGDATVSVGGGLVFASGGLQVEALHAADGTLAWNKDFSHLVWGPSYADGVVYISTTVFMSPLYALNPVDGSQIWSAQLHGNNSWPAVLNGGTLYLSRSDGETAQPAGYMYALNPANGAVLWEYTQSGVGFTQAIVE